MKKVTFLLIALIASVFAMNAQPEKAPMRSSIYDEKPSGFVQAGESSIYYSIAQREAAGPGTKWGISILGEIDGRYYSSTYGAGSLWSDNPGAGFITAFQVVDNDGTTHTANYLNSATTTEYDGVQLTPRVEGQGDVAARVIYSITNTNDYDVTVNVGAWADVYIGENDYAPIKQLYDPDGKCYALDLKESLDDDSPLLCVLFGKGVTGVTPIDEENGYWFGQYRNNYEANEIVGNYDKYITNFFGGQSEDYYWMSEEGGYDSGMGMCWRNRPIGAGETIEISFLVSVGNIPFDEPEDPDEPGLFEFTSDVEALNIEAWNDFSVAHPAHIWGHYEHPYGQEAYIEYQVDGGEWIRIETPLASGEDFDLPFNMFFNEAITDIHTLNLRYSIMGATTDIPGLEWVDVRSYTVEGVIPTFPYDGNPKTFEVIVNGQPVFIGGDDQYINEGTYTVVVAEGSFEENTIGVLTITFTIENTTAVNEVSAAGEDNGAWYTIDGRRVAAPVERGIYIHNGKKVVK